MSTCKSFRAFCQTRERCLTNPWTPMVVGEDRRHWESMGKETRTSQKETSPDSCIASATTSNPEGWMDDIWTEKHFFMVFLSHNYVLTMVNYVLIIFNRATCIYLPGTQQYLTYLPTYLPTHIESTYIPHSYLLYIIITNLFFWVQFSDVASIMNIPRGI
jgi:hypothetical protein